MSLPRRRSFDHGHEIEVLVEGRDLEDALRQLKKRIGRSGLFREARRHEFFMSPGQRRRLKSKRARQLLAKRAARREEAARA